MSSRLGVSVSWRTVVARAWVGLVAKDVGVGGGVVVLGGA